MTLTVRNIDSDPAALVASTDRYYKEHARDYFEKTVSADVEHLYDRFLPLLPARARILDAGSGSGRDLRAFRLRGYRPIGVDASEELVELAKAYSGAPCFAGRLEDLEYQECFDGLWACASVVHFPKSALSLVLERFRAALVAGGVMYVSVQNGTGEKLAKDGRFYAYYQRAEFLQILKEADFRVEDVWLTADALPGRDSLEWINVIARR
jgi:SAM-dependent methyltransferase